MGKQLEALCTSLDTLATTVKNAWGDERTLREVHGWHHPSMTRHDLAGIPSNLADKIRNLTSEDLDEKLLTQLQSIPAKLQLLHSETIPHLYDGNGLQAVPAYMTTMIWVTQLLEPLFTWKEIRDTEALPPQMAKKFRSYKSTLDQLAPNKEKLAEQIDLIQQATNAALSLPTDMQALQEARDEMVMIGERCAEIHRQINEQLTNTTTLAGQINDAGVKAEEIVGKCEEVFHITTTKGLAGAFDQRATALTTSMWVWVFWFVSALIVGGYIGSSRLDMLSRALSDSNPHWGVISIEVVLSILSLGGPVWFSWIATKQIGQRFRLAEDYAFKASVAKAYEGYRKEAARLDPLFESRLFSSALSRLEEAPLRFVENSNHGSPWHELMDSNAVKSAMSSIPSFKNDVIAMANKLIEGGKFSSGTPNASAGISVAKPAEE